ncbi:MAG: GLUG motif-containing protein [Planctomycetota bacterium]
MVIARISNLLGKITVFFVICFLVMVGLCVNIAVALDGSGTQEEPWRIKSLDDFNDFAADPNYWDDYTILETDVNLAGITYTTAVIAPDVNNVKYGFQGITFTGVFDGNDHKLINLTIDGGFYNDYLALVGYIDDGEIKNLGIECSFFYGDSPGDYSSLVGGLVGFNSGAITNCYSTGFIIGSGDYSHHIGGLVGFNSGAITNCYSTGFASGPGDYSSLVGGLVGENAAIISDCYSKVDVNGMMEIGGLCGYNSVTITNCYSTGDVNGVVWVGGLVGDNYGDVSNCYSTGDVDGIIEVGGLVGLNFGADSPSDCFWDTDTQTHGITESIGSDAGTAINVVGLPTAQMQTKSTFTDAGWDFVDVWLINEGAFYPVLRQEIRSDLNGDGGVDFLDFAIFTDHWLEGIE